MYPEASTAPGLLDKIASTAIKLSVVQEVLLSSLAA